MASYLVDDEEMDVCCRPSVIFVVVVAWVVDLEDLLPIFYLKLMRHFFRKTNSANFCIFQTFEGFILILTSQKCAIQQGVFCFLRTGRLNLTKESRKLNFKEILLLRVSFSAGNIFLVTVCQGQQSLPLAFQEDQGHCCKQQPDSPESGFGSLS